jgi:hypothetical protein
MMEIFFFAILHYLLIFLCQVINNTTAFDSVLVILPGLMVYNPVMYLSRPQAVLLYALTGLALDAIFQFLPFGLSMVFFIFFFCTQRCILNIGCQIPSTCRVIFEQLSNVVYICFLFIFREASFSCYQFLLTTVVSQLLLYALSTPIAALYRKIAFFCDEYARYQK